MAPCVDDNLSALPCRSQGTCPTNPPLKTGVFKHHLKAGLLSRSTHAQVLGLLSYACHSACMQPAQAHGGGLVLLAS